MTVWAGGITGGKPALPAASAAPPPDRAPTEPPDPEGVVAPCGVCLCDPYRVDRNVCHRCRGRRPAWAGLAHGYYSSAFQAESGSAAAAAGGVTDTRGGDGSPARDASPRREPFAALIYATHEGDVAGSTGSRRRLCESAPSPLTLRVKGGQSRFGLVVSLPLHALICATHKGWRYKAVAFGGLLAVVVGGVRAGESVGGGDPVLAAEQRRVDVIQRVGPSVVCLFDRNQRGGGSGVLIDREGYGLTNYHVVAAMAEAKGGLAGLSDGKLHDIEVLGTDPTGDVAMFRLTDAGPFPYASLGDSDAVRVGDEAIVMGNPFTLSEDYTPSVTVGLVTGVHRYQKGVKGNLTYTDCIQVDAAVNPGNSGGPLFNAAGEVIGINGRISVNTRGRYNVGLGYAISSNQIKRFIPALRAGLLARHGMLQATVDADTEGKIVFNRVGSDSNADKAGIHRGDRLLTFDGVPITSGNHYASLSGTYPADWPVPIEIEQEGQRRTVLVRLDAVNPKLRKPFTPDRDINMREVERVIRAFGKATLGSSEARRPMVWKWRLAREWAPGAGRAPEVYEVSQTGDGPVRMQRRYDDGSPGPMIVYDDRTATQRVDATSEAFDLAPDVGMVLSSLYVVQRWMLAPVETIDVTKVSHVGADRLIGDGSREGAILNVLEWPVGQNGVAKFGFDTQSGRLLQMRVRDVTSGAEATVDFLDYRSVGGIAWLHRIEVRGAGLEYRDVLSDLELTP